MTWSETQSRPSGWPRIPSCPARALVRFSKPEGTKSAFVFVYVSARTERACRLSYEELNRFLIWDFKKNIFLNHSNKSRLRHTPKVEYIIWISERSQVQGCTVRSPPWKKKNLTFCFVCGVTVFCDTRVDLNGVRNAEMRRRTQKSLSLSSLLLCNRGFWNSLFNRNAIFYRAVCMWSGTFVVYISCTSVYPERGGALGCFYR